MHELQKFERGTKQGESFTGLLYFIEVVNAHSC